MTQNKKKIEEPKDLGVTIGSKEQAYWEGAVEKAKQAVVDNEHELEINKAILEFAEKRLKEETAKFQA